MRDPERIDRIVDLLRERWHQEPDMRLGQLLEVSLRRTVGQEPGSSHGISHCIFHIEDTETEAALREDIASQVRLDDGVFI